MGSGLRLLGPGIHSGLTMKQSVRIKVADEVAADQALVDAIPAPGATLRQATVEEREGWLEEFRKACPEAFNRKVGAGLGPPERVE